MRCGFLSFVFRGCRGRPIVAYIYKRLYHYTLLYCTSSILLVHKRVYHRTVLYTERVPFASLIGIMTLTGEMHCGFHSYTQLLLLFFFASIIPLAFLLSVSLSLSIFCCSYRDCVCVCSCRRIDKQHLIFTLESHNGIIRV